MAHPPGHPLPSLIGRACALLPLGTIAFRVGLASALAGAAAAAQAARLGRLVAGRSRLPAQSDARIDELLGAAAGLTFGLSYAAAFQAVRPEVYALSALLVLTSAYELARYDEDRDRRRLLTAALAAGLALSNHHLLALTFAVPAALVFAPRVGWRSAGRALAVAAATLAAVWAYLPLRAARHPLVNWGAPTTAARMYWTLSARAFQKAVTRGQVADVGGVAGALAAELWLVGTFLALGGAYVLLRLGRWRLALLLLGAALLDAATPALVGFDPANPDAYGYLETAVALLAVLGCAVVAAVAAAVQRPRLMRAIAAALVVAVTAGGLAGRARFSRARFWDAGVTLGRFVDGAPPRARILTSDFQTVFVAWYLDAIEARRPDTELVHRHFLPYPGYREEIARKVGDVSREPDLIEYDLDLPPRYVASSTNVSVDLPGAPETWEPQTRRYAAWQAFLGADRSCHLASAGTDRALARARQLLELPSLNCDRLRDLVTITPP